MKLVDARGETHAYPLAAASPAHSSSGEEVQTITLASFFSRLACGDDMGSLIRMLHHTVQSSTLSVSGPLLHEGNSTGQQCTTSGVSLQEKGWEGRLTLKRAIKAALMFSTESRRASEEATILFHSSHVQKLLRHSPPVGQGGATQHVYQSVLNAHTAATLAKDKLRETSRVEEALVILEGVDPTPPIAAMRIALYSTTGEWARSLSCLEAIPEAEWTECDVGGTIRAIYRAVRAQKDLNNTKNTPAAAWHEGSGRLASQLLLQSAVKWSTPSAMNDTLGILSMLHRPQWHEVLRVLRATCTHKEEGDDMSDASNSSAEIRPNAATIYQLCRAMQDQPHLCVDWSTRIISQHSLDITDDDRATEQYLLCCVKAERAEEALQFIQFHSKKQCATPSSLDMHKGSPITMQYAPDLHIALTRLLEEKCKCYHRVLAPIHSLSKHTNTRTLYRSFNSLIQASQSVAEAEKYCSMMDSRTPSLSLGDGACRSPRRGFALENESYERLAMLHAQNGTWCQSLHCVQTLLYEPRRQRHMFVSSAELQYALSRAPPPGPQWQVAVRLFMDMCDGAHVPISTTAFQCVIQKCYASGAGHASQSLLRYLLMKGIHM